MKSPFVIFALYLTIPFSGFYTTKLGLSPIYLTFIFSTYAMLIGMLNGVKVKKIDSVIFISVLFLIYLFIAFSLDWSFTTPHPSAWVNLIFSLAYLIITIIIAQNSTQSHLLRATEYTFIFSIILLSLELTYRLTNPVEPEGWTTIREDIFWYQYKTSSFMYPDSNSVGLFTTCLFAFAIGIHENFSHRFKKYLAPLFFFTIGSLSRSAIITALLIILYNHAKDSKFKPIILTTFTTIALYLIYIAVESDESFMSKFWIAELAAKYISNADNYTLLIGTGPGNAERELGIGSHLLSITLLIEIGIIGTIFTTTLWSLIWLKSGKHGTPIFIAILINGLSFTTFATPWFYSLTTILIYLSRVTPNEGISPHSRI